MSDLESDEHDRRSLEKDLSPEPRARNTLNSNTNNSVSADQPAEQGFTLYISGLARSMKEEDLRELFSPFGPLQRCQVVIDPHTKENRGFGFVCFNEEGEAQAAIDAWNGKECRGRVLSVERARRSRPRSPTPGKYHGPKDTRRNRRDTYRGRRRSRSRSRSPSRGRDYRKYYRDRPVDRYEPSRAAPSYYGGGDRDYSRSFERMPPPTYYGHPPPRDLYGPPGSRYDAYTQPPNAPMYMPPPPLDYERRYPPPAMPPSGMPPRPRSPYHR